MLTPETEQARVRGRPRPTLYDMIYVSDDIVTKPAFLSAERKILMNWKQCGPNCFHMQNWCKDFTDLLSKEQVALTLQDGVIPDQLHGPWIRFALL